MSKLYTDEQLEQTKAIIAQERRAVHTLTGKLIDITDKLGLDEEKMNRRISSALRSEYGRVNGMINLLAQVANWPAEAGDGATVEVNKKIIRDELDVDTMLLEDIRTYRGFHTFHNDDLEVVKGQEPDYENYAMYCAIYLGDLGLENHKPTISKDTWDINEKKAIKDTNESIESMRRAVEDHKRLLDEGLEG